MSLKLKIDFYKNVAKMASLYPKEQRKSIFIDYLKLYDTKGLTIEEYRDFEFERQDEAFRRSFLGLNEQRYYLDLLNPKKYYILSRNKYLAHRVLEHVGVQMPDLYAYYSPEGSAFLSDVVVSNCIALVGLLSRKQVSSCVVKATEGAHGDNVTVVKEIEYTGGDCNLTLYDGRKTLLSSLLGKDPLLFESVVKQTAQMEAFNQQSVNTVRIMTVLMPDGQARVIDAWFKLGHKGSCVDNAGSGGNIDGCVDVSTGEMKCAVQFDGFRNVKKVERHPDSNVQINGVRIEGWEDVKSRVVAFQEAFPFCKAAGWDIAITDDGPVVIEVNDMWDRTGQLFTHHGWRDDIRDCYMKWKSTGVDYIMSRDSNALNMKRLKKVIENEWR